MNIYISGDCIETNRNLFLQLVHEEFIIALQQKEQRNFYH